MPGESWKTRIFRYGMNCYPMFFGTGGKVLSIDGDWRRAVVGLRMSLWTRNYVGTIFGGSMFAAVDPFHIVMLINILGKGYVVWDKAASIRFRRPGKSALRAEIAYSEDEIAHIVAQAAAQGKYEFVKSVDWVDSQGEVISTIEKTIYVATKEHFAKRKDRAVTASS